MSGFAHRFSLLTLTCIYIQEKFFCFHRGSIEWVRPNILVSPKMYHLSAHIYRTSNTQYGSYHAWVCTQIFLHHTLTFRWGFLCMLFVFQFWVWIILNCTIHKQWKTLEQKLILWLTFNLGLELTGFRTTQPCFATRFLLSRVFCACRRLKSMRIYWTCTT